MIRFENVTKRYPNGQDGLRQLTFQVAKGEMIFLTGHSGAGKSTLLKLICLIERPTQGQIYIANQSLNRLSKRRIPHLRRTMGIVFQNPHLLKNNSVFENVALPLVISGYQHNDIQKRVRAALDKVGLLTKERLYPDALSAGEQQRVSIARAVVNKPTLLIADEPTGNLDPNLSLDIMRLFHQFHQVGVTVIIATHDLSLIKHFNHRVLTLHQGLLLKETQEVAYA